MTRINSDNLFGLSPYIVDAIAGNGSFTTVQSAIDAANASGGGVVYIRGGSYTENLSFLPNVILIGVAIEGSGGEVVITGNHTFSTSGNFGAKGIYFGVVAGDTITLNPGAAGLSSLSLDSCTINSSTGRTLVCNAPGASTIISATEIIFDANQEAIASVAGTNDLFVEICELQSSGGTAVSVAGGGTCRLRNCSSAASVDSIRITSAAASLLIEDCSFTAPQAGIRYLAAGSVELYHSTIDAADASGNFVVGAGTLRYGDLLLLGSAINIDAATTATATDWKPYATAGTSATAVKGTAGFNDAQFSSTLGFISLKGTNSTLPAFQAYKSANTLNATGNGTVVTVIFDVEAFDQGGNYNNATGVFTAPVTGKYYFYHTIAALNIGAAHTSGTSLFLVNGVTTYVGQSQNAAAMRELSANSLNWLAHDIISLTAGDTVICRLVISGGAATVTLAGNVPPLLTTRWGGWLIA